MPSSPVLSIIVPVYNDPDGLRQTLSSLVDQPNTPEFEIIVVDNNSTDETPQVIREFERRYSDIIFGFSETDIQSSYAARNTGIKQASGEILAFIDADVIVGDTWITDVWHQFQESNVDYLGCNVEMYIPNGNDTFWARYDCSMGLPVRHYIRTKQFAPTCALALRRSVLDEVGCFDEELVSGGDKEFGHRVSTAGFKLEFAPKITVQHPARSTFKSHIGKAIRIGEGQFRLWKEHDLASHPFSPIRILPPSPSRVRERKRNKQNFAATYATAYLFKVIQAISAASEAF
ncbi:glycosyltransferase [Halobacterium sp. NMX12-1]|uniref:Glycosyltransferase n=1 Tax=Halobacterium sp. NMX12-1 TaxID=3166650 RepID=A0AAU8C9N4_9EURY